jgi:hypothetical protein
MRSTGCSVFSGCDGMRMHEFVPVGMVIMLMERSLLDAVFVPVKNNGDFLDFSDSDVKSLILDH